MKKNKRLFLFAGYDPDGIIDDTLLCYLKALSEFGDIVLIMDCYIKDKGKLKDIKNLLYVETSRHDEYDFGSYKRAYMWAHNKKILDKYDWVYLVNDSVYGPLFDMQPVFTKLESNGADFTGLTDFFDNRFPKHIQSYFVGLSKRVANSKILYDFMKKISHKDSKWEIIYEYESGLSRTLLQNGFKMFAIINQNGEKFNTIYNKPKEILENFIPFIKKSALSKFESIISLLPYTSEKNVDMIYNHAKRIKINITNSKDLGQIIIHPYKKIYRFTLLSIPIFTVYKKEFGGKSYKICIFDKIPVAKITRI